MGRTTFEPALTNDRWPWPDLKVSVLGSKLPPGTPDHVVSDSDPAQLWEKLRAATWVATSILSTPLARSRPSALSVRSTSSNWWCLPLLFGAGMRFTPSLSPDTA